MIKPHVLHAALVVGGGFSASDCMCGEKCYLIEEGEEMGTFWISQCKSVEI